MSVSQRFLVQMQFGLTVSVLTDGSFLDCPFSTGGSERCETRQELSKVPKSLPGGLGAWGPEGWGGCYIQRSEKVRKVVGLFCPGPMSMSMSFCSNLIFSCLEASPLWRPLQH